MLMWLVLVAVVLGLVVLILRDPGDGSALQVPGLLDFNSDDLAVLLGRAAVLAFVAIGLVSLYRGRSRQAVKDIAIWSGLLAVLVVGYSYRNDLSLVAGRVAGELAPPGQAVSMETGNGERAVRIRRRGDGHFVARTAVNGVALNMLVDTGASTVVLRPSDARAIGIDPDGLAYTVAVQTANGTTYAAPVRLPGVSIGPIAIRQVEALVARPGSLKESLLGMSFLRRLRSYEFAGDFLTLRS